MRVSDEFDIKSEVGKGTIVTSLIYTHPEDNEGEIDEG
jgi:hypothetical protein